MYIVLALLSGVLFGIWKFGLGRYRGNVSTTSIVLVSAVGAGVVYLLIGLVVRDLVFDREDVVPALIGGVCNLFGNVLIVMAFARGKLGVVSGVALAGVLVPLAYSLMIGESLTAAAALGILFVLAGLIAFFRSNAKESTSTQQNTALAIGLALAAAFAWGIAIVVIDVGTRVSMTATMLVSEIPQVLFTLVFLAVVQRSWGGLGAQSTGVLALAGVALGVGNMLFFTASNEGDIGIASVLGSISPIIVALLAYLFLKERLVRAELVAFAIVLVGAALVVV